ncbi:glycosyltransferase family 4 protein [Tessaracoccus sp. MC1679]|uniref:glycosyltransferase family protein n=1 Tax=Tessaracoccus sp. MC1679 TaxID=2760313 RepID=UPI00160053EE|nr:glycosyltransferase [Tessaracoccus sp. MC1679]MBB1517110.1 glycosyltransferase family 4 protein [Tessaracoccus sp. MC1679]
MRRALVLTTGRAADGPYGIDKLRGFGYELVDVPDARARLHRKLRDVVEHRTRRPLDKTLRSTLKAWRSDLVIAFLEREALAASWLKQRRLPPWRSLPLVMFECWLAEELRHADAATRRNLVKSYAGVDLTFAWSANQLDILHDAGFHPDRLASVPFGFAPENHPFVPQAGRQGGIVAIGFDRGRDYPTLFDAVAGTDLVVDLYCKEVNLGGRTPPPGVNFRGTVPSAEYARLIADAEIVVIPTKDLAYPTGQTVAMEAAGAGACVVVSGTAPMREYFTDSEALLFDPGDASGLREQLMRARDDFQLRDSLGRAAAERMRGQFTYTQMWQRVDRELRTRGLVGGKP